MPRYYDMDKLKEMIEAKAGMLVEGKEAFFCVAKWLDLLPPADVVPRAEFERLTTLAELGNTRANDYRARDALFEIEDLHIVLKPAPNSINDPLNSGPTICIKWKQGGAQYGTYHHFDEDNRAPTIEEVVKEANAALDQFLRATKAIAMKGATE